MASQFEQEKQDKSAIRSAAAGVEPKDNTCGVAQVLVNCCSDYGCSLQQILKTPTPCCPDTFDTVPELHDLNAHLSRLVSIWVNAQAMAQVCSCHAAL